MSNRTVTSAARAALLVASAVSAVALGGCGSDDGNSDVGARAGKDGVRDVVPVYARALADGDGTRACSLMSMPAQEALKQRTGGADCLQAVKSIAGKLDPQSAESLRKIKMGDPKVDGDSAVVGVELNEVGRPGAAGALGSTQLRLVEIDGRWHIDAEPTKS